jgi:hypothetical protein
MNTLPNEQAQHTLEHFQPPKLTKKLTLRRETIKELTADQLQTAAGGTGSSIILRLISRSEHVWL